MNSLLTSIAGQFAKPLLLSALLPVVVVTSLFVLLTYSLFPFALPPPVTRLDSSWQVGWSVLLAVVVAMLLFVLNTPIARMFSGYPWMDTPPGKLLAGYQRRRFRRLRARRDGLLELWDGLDPRIPREKELGERLWRAVIPLAQRLNDEFPYADKLVMPTRLGNTIRNFEEYSSQQYGISAVPLWPRLIGVIEQRYATVLDDAKMHFDFALNCLVLFCLAAALTAGLAVARDASGDVRTAAALRVTLFVVLAGLSYAAAVNRAQAWGTHVKAAIDLHRERLMRLLGYKHTLVDVADERKRIWPLLASEWRYPDMRRALDTLPFAPPPVAPSPPTSASDGRGQALPVTRGISPPRGTPFPATTVTLRVHNPGAADARDVKVTDSVPPNWSFVWGSADSSSGRLAVKGSQPVVLEVSRLAAGASCTLTYQLQSLVAT